MKKFLAILTVVVFFAAISLPAYSSDSNTAEISLVNDEKPKKEAAKKDKNKSDCKTAEKKSDCTTKKEKSCDDKDKK